MNANSSGASEPRHVPIARPESSEIGPTRDASAGRSLRGEGEVRR